MNHGVSVCEASIRYRHPGLSVNASFSMRHSLADEYDPFHNILKLLTPDTENISITMQNPKVFISYSWTSPGYKEQVLDIADRLIKEDKVDVIIDEYDLKGGQDVVAFMEQLRTDQAITHVLVLCDASYVAKADARKRGVGTEAQIISLDVYNDIGQTRVIPILMERTSDGDPCLPTFLQSRMYFDFSSQESMHREWEKLGRHLWGKPIRTKPALGESPKYLSDKGGGHFVGLKRTWQSLRLSILDGKPSMAVLREELLDCFETEITEAFRSTAIQSEANEDLMAQWERCLAIQVEARDVLLDWALTEARIDAERATAKCLIPILERINIVPRFAENGASPSQVFRDAMSILGYEMALYLTACLIEVDAPAAIKQLLQHPIPDRSHYGDKMHTGLSEFCHYSKFMNNWNAQQEKQWVSPIAHRIIERCTHTKLRKDNILEAEAVLFMFNVLNQTRWYPYTAVYTSRGSRFPWFQKAKVGKSPDRLAMLTGRASWQAVREEFTQTFQDITRNSRYEVFSLGRGEYIERMSLEDER